VSPHLKPPLGPILPVFHYSTIPTTPGPLGAKNAKRTQFAQTGRQAGAPERENVRNEPNLAEPAGGPGPWRAKRAKRTQFPATAGGAGDGTRKMQNEPNLHPRGSIGGASPTLHMGRIAQNKPNLAWRAGGPGPRRAKTCQTNPISEEVSSVKYQVLCWASRPASPRSLLTANFTLQTSHCGGAAGSIVQNEPNLPRDRVSGIRDQSTDTRPPVPDPWSTAADCAKRSQFGRARAEAGALEGEMCKTNPICPGIGFQGSGIGQLTPDPRPLEHRGQLCKTKPIWSGPRRGRGLGGRNVQNEPNFRPGGQRGGGQGQALVPCEVA
jgi:hypothetical protein